MRITVHCGCDTPYEFDIEPVNGAMPHAVQCPHCGADGTEFANAVIQNELATAAPEAPAAPRFCRKHEGEPITNECFLCKRPLCLQCMAQFGYFCSLTCRRKAGEKNLKFPEYELQESVIQERTWRRVKRLGAIATLLLIAWIGLWAWYRFHASRPQIRFSAAIPEKERISQCRFLDSDLFLTLGAKKITVYSASKRGEVWSRDLTPYTKLPQTGASEPEGGAAGDESLTAEQKTLVAQMRSRWSDDDAPEARLHVTPTDLWLVFPSQAVRMDRASGNEKSKTPIHGSIESVTPGENTLEIITRLGNGRENLIQIDLKSGEAQSETRDPPPQPVYAGVREVTTAEIMAGAEGPDYSTTAPNDQRKLIPTGPNVAHLDIHLVKANFVAYEAMKAKTESALANANVSVLDTRKVAEEISNDMKRSAGRTKRHEDESTYEVTLRRVFAEPNEWKAEVTGSPELFAQKTVDVLVSGKTLRVFDKGNSLLWEAKLSFPIASVHSFSDTEAPSSPCVERGDTLYFFDRGVLTAFEKSNGKVRWRLPSVGVSRIQFDDRGMLYVNTTSADPETIQYSEQLDFDKMGVPVLMKVHARDGRKLWTLEKPGDQCLVTGRFLYLTTAGTSHWEMLGSMLNGGGGRAPVHFRLHRLDPKTGKEIWEYHVTKQPENVDIQENRILLQYPNEIQVLKFLAF